MNNEKRLSWFKSTLSVYCVLIGVISLIGLYAFWSGSKLVWIMAIPAFVFTFTLFVLHKRRDIRSGN
jgi:hypothetical protein